MAGSEKQWTTEQHAFMSAWKSIQEEHSSPSEAPLRGRWPEENTPLLDMVEEARRAYYSHLSDTYFSSGDIVLELGADSRNSWVDCIDTTQTVVVRTTWSQRANHPSIWQIPVQQLLGILDSPRFEWMARLLTAIVMENTMGCLPLPAPKALLSFASKYRIRIVELTYRPLSTPRLSDIKARPDRRFNPNQDCPAFAVAAAELLHLAASKKTTETTRQAFYLYRPPTGSPIAQLRYFPSTPEGDREWLKAQQSAEHSGGAVHILEVPTPVNDERDDATLRLFALLLRSLLQLQERPDSKYRAHMTKSSQGQELTTMSAWFLGIRRQARQEGLDAKLHIDTVGGRGTEEHLHTASGEWINPSELVAMWLKAGFPESRIRDYAYGLAGYDQELMQTAIQRNWIAENVFGIFQTSRIHIEPRDTDDGANPDR
jgi:hypothetical protein